MKGVRASIVEAGGKKPGFALLFQWFSNCVLQIFYLL